MANKMETGYGHEEEAKEPQGQEMEPVAVEDESKKKDTAFYGAVSRYFEDRCGEITNSERITEEDRKYEAFLKEQRDTLHNLVSPNPKLREKMPLPRIASALFELQNMMATTNRELLYNDKTDPETRKDYEKKNFEARKIFMEACKRVFPEISPETRRDLPYSEFKKLENLDIGTPGNFSITETQKLLAENPRKLAEQIDDGLFFSAEGMRAFAFDAFQNDDEERKKFIDKKLGMGIPSVYKLQLMRDQLTKQIYGREDITPSEQGQIDQTREKIK